MFKPKIKRYIISEFSIRRTGNTNPKSKYSAEVVIREEHNGASSTHSLRHYSPAYKVCFKIATEWANKYLIKNK